MWVLIHSSPKLHLPLINYQHGSLPIGGYFELDLRAIDVSFAFCSTGVFMWSSILGILGSQSPKVQSITLLGSLRVIPSIYSIMKLIIDFLWSSIILLCDDSYLLSSCSIRVAISREGIQALMAKAPSIYGCGTISVAFSNWDSLLLTLISLTDLFFDGIGWFMRLVMCLCCSS